MQKNAKGLHRLTVFECSPEPEVLRYPKGQRSIFSPKYINMQKATTSTDQNISDTYTNIPHGDAQNTLYEAVAVALTHHHGDPYTTNEIHEKLKRLVEAFRKYPKESTTTQDIYIQNRLNYLEECSQQQTKCRHDIFILACLLDTNAVLYYQPINPNLQKKDNWMRIQFRGGRNLHFPDLHIRKQGEWYNALIPKEQSVHCVLKYKSGWVYEPAIRPARSLLQSDTKPTPHQYSFSKVVENEQVAENETKFHNELADAFQSSKKNEYIIKQEFSTVRVDAVPISERPNWEIHASTRSQPNSMPDIEFTQITYSECGLRISDTKLASHELIDPLNIFAALTPIFKGLRNITSLSIAHLGIHPQNLIYIRDTGKIKLLETKTFRTFEALNTKDKTENIDDTFFIYPDEFRKALRSQFPDQTQQDKTAASSYNNQFQDAISQLNQLKRTTDVDQNVKKALEDVLRQYGYDSTGKTENYALTPSQIDVYSLGVTIIFLFSQFSIFKPASVRDSATTFAQILNLCAGMLQPDPTKRTSIQEATTIYTKIWDSYAVKRQKIGHPRTVGPPPTSRRSSLRKKKA